MRAVVHRTPVLEGQAQIAGSKNYTSRYILAATLAAGQSVILNPAPIDDAFAMAECCSGLGAEVDTSDSRAWRIKGTGGQLRGRSRLNVRNAGAVARFLIAVCSTSPDPIEIYTSYPDSLGRRPQKDLLDALATLGAAVSSHGGRLPVTVSRGTLSAGEVQVSGATSSQYLTGLLFLSPLLFGQTQITVPDTLRSKPSIDQTLDVLKAVGIEIDAADDRMSFRVSGPQSYQSGSYRVPGDWPSAAAILSAAAVTQSDVTVHGVYKDSQGEVRVLDVLERMGATITYSHDDGQVRLQSDGVLHPIEFDGDLATDAVLSMVAVASFARGTSRFYNLHTLRHKESDRITDFCRELRKCGVHVEEGPSEIIVHGNEKPVPGGTDIAAYHDHRIIMALSIVGLRSESPIVLHDIENVAKSYPNFFVTLRSLGAHVEVDADYFTHVATTT